MDYSKLSDAEIGQMAYSNNLPFIFDTDDKLKKITGEEPQQPRLWEDVERDVVIQALEAVS